jgi:Ca-activated chloride channel family protein
MALRDEKQVPMPLKHTDVKAHVTGQVGSVEVSQQFYNPYETRIEAVYVFPLPHNATINEFVMVIGERRIRGIIREREEAEQIYLSARNQGYVASLMTEERPNIFTQSVANIEPGKDITVDIKYFHTLEYADSWYEFVFPMVVGPRFNPPGSTNGIGAVARDDSGSSAQTKEVQYLRPREATGRDISLSLDLHAGVPIEEFECKTHEIDSQTVAPDHLSVALKPTDNLPNRDFVLRYRVAGEKIKTGFLTHADKSGGYFSLVLYPPAELNSLNRAPVEMVFVIDCSGSMSGRPIQQAKAAVERGLRLLRRGDSFQLISFSISASQLGTQPLKATSQNIAHALEYLGSLQSEGGTMMIEGIKASLDFPRDSRRQRYVCFLTDGFIGHEAEIFAEIQ